MVEEERNQRFLEAMMHTLVTCTTLWGGFWLQFVIGIMYNMPALHTLLRGNWYPPYVVFYFPVHSPLPISLAEIFAWLSVFGSVLALCGVWHWTSGVRGRWRMRILVTGFAGLLCLWSLAALAAEDAAWRALEDRRTAIRQQIRQGGDADWLRVLKGEDEWIEQLLKMRR